MAMVGIGVGGAEILPAMDSTAGIELSAGADINPVTLERFHARYPEARTYDSIEKLCEDPDVDAIWISTPNRFHAPQTIYALNHGKHVVIEKPMALSIQEAEAMCDAAAKNNRVLMAGHTESYSYQVRAMRKIVNSGKIGKATNMHAIAFTDWIMRPRSAEEMDPTQGGGLVWRQVPHQVDSIRLIGGGRVRSVRGTTGRGASYRPFTSFYSAFLDFEDGTPAYVVHDGQGYFNTTELMFGENIHSRYSSQQRGELRRAMRAGARDEEADKQALRIGGEQESGRLVNRRPEGPPRARWNFDVGFIMVSTENGFVRHSPTGLMIYDDDGEHEIDLRGNNALGGPSRQGELSEFYKTIVEGAPMFHDGLWGMGTLEVSLAIQESAKDRREIMLSHQKAVPVDYDKDLKVPYLEGN
jgi:phthalate 4,5-cis-dihydrodiol dehydrogenase